MAEIIKDKRFLIMQNAFVDWATGALLSPVETEHYTIVQVAESYFIGGFDPHAHRQLCDLEITQVLTGAVTSSADGREERTEKNGAYISLRGEEHWLYSKSSCRFLTLAINFKEPMQPLFAAIRERFSEKRTLSDADPAGLLSRIAAEFSGERRPFFESYLDALIGELLISLVRPEPAPLPNASADEKMAEIIHYIDCNIFRSARLRSFPASDIPIITFARASSRSMDALRAHIFCPKEWITRRACFPRGRVFLRFLRFSAIPLLIISAALIKSILGIPPRKEEISMTKNSREYEYF